MEDAAFPLASLPIFNTLGLAENVDGVIAVSVEPLTEMPALDAENPRADLKGVLAATVTPELAELALT